MTRIVFALVAVMGLALGLLVAAPVEAQPEHFPRIVAVRDLNFLAEPRADAEVLAVIPAGTELTFSHQSVTGPDGGSYMVLGYDGQVGYISNDGWVHYDEYYGTEPPATEPATTLPNTGVGTTAGATDGSPLNLSLNGLFTLGLAAAAALVLRRRAHR